MSAPDGPRFSVVMPAYNSTATIGSAVRSVLDQTAADLELIVVDDGSADGTADLVEGIAAEDGRVRVVRQENTGTAGARNTGIGLCRGELVSFLDNDDLWMPGYLAGMSAALDSDPEAGFAYTDAYVLHDATKRINRETELECRPPPAPGATREQILRRLVEDNFVMSSVTVRRPVLERLGGFETEVSGVDDYELWLRIVAAGYRAVQAEGVLLIQRNIATSQSKDELFMSRGLRESLRRVAEDWDVPEEIRELARRRTREIEHYARPQGPRDRLMIFVFLQRVRLTRLVNRFWRGRYLRDEPPPEVAAAFPDLDQV